MLLYAKLEHSRQLNSLKLKKIQDRGNSRMKSINCFELKKHINGRVIAPVEEATAWSSSLAIATKKSGTLNLCIDPSFKGEIYQLPELAQTKCSPL